MALADNWGATAAELAAALPCDEFNPDARIRCHRAISVRAAPAITFRWLCQLRLAPYSYDLLDNFGRRSPRTLTPGAERLSVGQRFMRIFRLASFDRDEQITLTTAGTSVTYAVRAEGGGSRLLVRVLFEPSGRLTALAAPLLPLGDLVMMRKQLLTLRDLAELQQAEAPPSI